MKTLTVEDIRATLREKIPEGLVVAEHNEFGHFYRHTKANQLFPSVTTKGSILDAPHLKKWAARKAAEHMVEKILENPKLYTSRESLEELAKAATLVHQDQFEEAGDIGGQTHKVIERYLEYWMTNEARPADIKMFMAHGTEEWDNRVFAGARSAELFCKEFYVKPIASEMLVASLRYRFAGTLDSLMMVLDIKQKGNRLCEDQMSIEGTTGREHDFIANSTSNPNKVACLHCGLKGEYVFAIVDWKTSNSIDKVEYAMQTAAYWQAFYEMTGLRPKKIYIVRLDKKFAKYDVSVLTHRSNAFKAFFHTTKIYDWLNDGTPKLMSASPKERVSLDSMLDPI